MAPKSLLKKNELIIKIAPAHNVLNNSPIHIRALLAIARPTTLLTEMSTDVNAMQTI